MAKYILNKSNYGDRIKRIVLHVDESIPKSAFDEELSTKTLLASTGMKDIVLFDMLMSF
jgi:hypothetical protein